MLTLTCCGALTTTMADADFVGSALLTALIVYVPAVAGAVYLPVDDGSSGGRPDHTRAGGSRDTGEKLLLGAD